LASNAAQLSWDDTELWEPPGPTYELSWQRKVLEYLLSQLANMRGKLHGKGNLMAKTIVANRTLRANEVVFIVKNFMALIQ
jgi:hypothetical protein